MQQTNLTLTLGDLRDFVESCFRHVTEKNNKDDFNNMKDYTEILADSLIKNIPITKKMMILLPNGYLLPAPAAEIFLEFKSLFEPKLAASLKDSETSY